MMRYKFIKLGVFSLVLAGSALHAAHTTAQNWAGPSATVSFDAGKATLTAEAKDKLKEMVTAARKEEGKLEEVQVAVWSDNPLPRKGEELSAPDRQLAKDRALAIKKYLVQLKVSDVEQYNMAERASWLARAFDTEEAELKKELNLDPEGPMSKESFKVFRDNGQASKAVVVTILRH